METKEILIKYFGVREEDERFGYHLVKNANISEEKILKMMDFFMRELDINKTEFVKIVNKHLPILLITEEKFLSKIEFFRTEFKLENAELKFLFKYFPPLLSIKTDTLLEKIKFFEQEFNIKKEEFSRMIQIFPVILGFSQDSLIEKFEFYHKEFSVTKNEFRKFLKTFPHIISYSEKNVLEKAEFFEKQFYITRKQFIDMFKRWPKIITGSEESLILKKKILDEINFSKDDIIKNPNILFAPTNALKIRFMIQRLIASKNEVIDEHDWFITNQSKTYARLSFLLENNKKIKIKQLNYSEKQFLKQFRVTSDYLLQKYPLTKESIKMIEQNYNEIASQDEKIKISDKELAMLFN